MVILFEDILISASPPNPLTFCQPFSLWDTLINLVNPKGNLAQLPTGLESQYINSLMIGKFGVVRFDFSTYPKTDIFSDLSRSGSCLGSAGRGEFAGCELGSSSRSESICHDLLQSDHLQQEYHESN